MQNTDILKLAQNYVANVDANWNYILPTQLRTELLEGKKYFLLDTRKPVDFAKSHISGSTNIFWLDLFQEENLVKLPKDTTIVVVCYVGHTASQILVLLKMLGYSVRVLKFGMGKGPVVGVPIAGWENYGFETVTSL